MCYHDRPFCFPGFPIFIKLKTKPPNKTYGKDFSLKG